MIRRGWDMTSIADFDGKGMVRSVSFRDRIRLNGKKIEIIKN